MLPSVQVILCRNAQSERAKSHTPEAGKRREHDMTTVILLSISNIFMTIA